ncbi:unnamed protein product [Phytophthora fragariaefolia]|uniref:Unnamed protein product n=1 Tax=Phytophthora fragariaefolia TaxID=1490495 RepID=A0A9W6TSP7_9STRA|nr:unnamed protein product [Phytophthora fragariaefolia]
MQAKEGAAEAAAETSVLVDSGKPQRKPRATQRKLKASTASADTETTDSSDLRDSAEAEMLAETANVSVIAIQDALVTSDGPPSATFEAPVSLPPLAAIRPLTYLSAISVDPVAAVGFVRWKVGSGMGHVEYFSVNDDAIVILTSASIQINVELEHSAMVAKSSPVIFKVWAGVEMLSKCESSVRREGDRVLSVLQLGCTLPAETIIRVEYHGAGVVYSGSRLVLRLLNT